MNKRKRPLLRNEIKMLQIILREEAYPTLKYRLELADRLEDLKKEWYKVREPKHRSKK